MIVEELKKSVRAIDLAVSSGRKRQSPRTGFVHCFPHDELASDTIPLYENFCFALALFRQKTAESVLEGKELISRLLAFQSPDGNFPVYLHDFPKCWDFHLASKIAPVLIYLLRDFGAVLDGEFKGKVEKSLKRIGWGEEGPKGPPETGIGWGEEGPKGSPETAQEWFDWVVASQLRGESCPYPIPYDASLQVFLGKHAVQERGEPGPVPIEYLLAEKEGMGKRLLRDHINQLYTALLYPLISSESSEPVAKSHLGLNPRFHRQDRVPEHMSISSNSLPFVSTPLDPEGLRLFWKGETLHTLLFPKGKVDGNRIVYELPANPEIGRDDLYEVVFFTDISSETSISIDGKRGMVFGFGNQIAIETPGLKLEVRFELLEGEGTFCGHISRSNRPGQTGCRGSAQYEAYDWQIGLRTLRRNGPCQIAAQIYIEFQ